MANNNKILMIDNYDSFTYNVVHLIHEAINTIKQNQNYEIIVKYNDKITIDEIKQINPLCIFISPGPCSPNEAGICLDIIANFYKSIPIFGVCLGHQAICQFFGGEIAKVFPFHGRASNIILNGGEIKIDEITNFSYTDVIEKSQIFDQIPSGFEVIRYHSLALNPKIIPNDLKITAIAQQDGVIMAAEHKKYKVFGVQFHPESILSQFGVNIIKNFFKLILQ